MSNEIKVTREFVEYSLSCAYALLVFANRENDRELKREVGYYYNKCKEYLDKLNVEE